jgi:hypothetical protein
MFELYQTDRGSRGSMAEVWIDRDNKVVRKLYKPNGQTITGKQPLHTEMEVITRLYQSEIRWTTQLQGRYVCEIYDHGELKDEPGYFVLQEAPGPDLLSYPRDQLDELFPGIIQQIIGMFAMFKQHNLHKRNNAMANLTGANGRIKAFDFKYACERTDESRVQELHSIETWLSKIDPQLKELLLKYV